MTDPLSFQAGDLCTACGLCCAGSLFNFLTLELDDIEPGVRLGLPINIDEDGLSFDFPCPKLAGTCCTVYDDRPSGCRTYRCKLLKRLDADEVPLRHAIEIAESARDAFRLVQAELGEETIPQYRRRRVAALERNKALPRTPARDRLNELDAILDQHFRKPSQNQTIPFNGVEGRGDWISMSMAPPDPA